MYSHNISHIHIVNMEYKCLFSHGSSSGKDEDAHQLVQGYQLLSIGKLSFAVFINFPNIIKD